MPSECRIVSAHRTPLWLAEFAVTAESRGIEVVIAGLVVGRGTALRCWEEDEGLLGVLGAPAGGYCTSFCLSSPDCAVFDAIAACVRFGAGETGFCVSGCLAQPPTAVPALCRDRAADAGVASGDAG